ncbi:MAG TPA: DEAD/DEAH box helicase, partial [Candidatus Obscuribacterales bacterium]
FKIGKDGSSGSKTNLPVEIEFRESGREFFASGQTFNLVGGTAWAFSHPDAEAKLDYLFVDEAGQVSMANLVGMSPSTQNIVLLGDQMQLEQPIQGSHPGESGQSILDYLLQDHATIPQTLGIFLSTTRRMHPELCKVVSSAVYEDRLHSEAGNESQVLIMPPALSERFGKEAGIIFVPVKHEGNTQGSVEEADAIAHLASELQMCQVFDKQLGAARKITLNDILIVAPYNMQVRLIASRLPDARVASVDKFQGQEAPIVILSMCASEGTASPRGMEFLLSKNRLNVAISRAKSSAFVVANPDLVRTPCTTIEQMKQLNFFCQIVEAGSERRAGLCKGVTTYAECATRDA